MSIWPSPTETCTVETCSSRSTNEHTVENMIPVSASVCPFVHFQSRHAQSIIEKNLAKGSRYHRHGDARLGRRLVWLGRLGHHADRLIPTRAQGSPDLIRTHVHAQRRGGPQTKTRREGRTGGESIGPCHSCDGNQQRSADHFFLRGRCSRNGGD